MDENVNECTRTCPGVDSVEASEPSSHPREQWRERCAVNSITVSV